jgi:putative RNA 2'-phosphotransferase
MTDATELDRVVRVLACALRHQPLKYGVVLDAEGYADIDELVVGIRFSHYAWAAFDRHAVEAAIGSSTAGRFELRGNRIRACYGHSMTLNSSGQCGVPPEVLFHGTPAVSVATVLVAGLLPMSRAFVHLTAHLEYAKQVARAKGGGDIVCVRAKDAAGGGINFFQANLHVWLARKVPAKFLSLQVGDLASGQGAEYPAPRVNQIGTYCR